MREWKKNQDELKGLLGYEYEDHNLAVTLPNGRPCKDRIIEKAFVKLKNQAELLNVIFHSLRHSSTTYKLKLNHGDLKATQGDTGHAQKFDMAFYTEPDLRKVEVPRDKLGIDLQDLIEQLKQSPELADTLPPLSNHNRSIATRQLIRY